MKEKRNSRIVGVVLAGGRGTRLMPLTSKVPKPLLKVGNKLMIEHVLEKLSESEIKEVLICIKESHCDLFKAALSSPEKYGLMKIDYVFDQENVNGLPSALKSLEGKVDEKFIVVCADVLFDSNYKIPINNYLNQEQGARVLLFNLPDTAGYGLMTTKGKIITAYLPKDKTRHVQGFVESGIYLFNKDIFKRIDNIIAQEDGETKIKDLLDLYIREGALLFDVYEGWWSDVGKSVEEYQSVDKKYKDL